MTTRCINSRSLSLSLSPQQRRRRLNSPRCVMLASRARTRGSMTTCPPCSGCWGRSLPCTISLFLPPFILAFYRWKIPVKSISPHKFSVPKCRRGLQYGEKNLPADAFRLSTIQFECRGGSHAFPCPLQHVSSFSTTALWRSY